MKEVYNMCEKIRDGKVLSPPSDGDIDESFPRDWKPIKKTKKKKRSPKRIKVCKSCSRNITKLQKRDLMRYTNKYDQELAKEYCKEHERAYSDHHSCTPHWCGDCGYLIKYEVVVNSDYKD